MTYQPFLPPTTPALADGTATETMWCGFRVPVVVLSSKHVEGWMGREYRVRYTGERRCLDFGQNWYAKNGDEFTVRQVNIDAAAEYKAAGY